ncbi:TetR/AcrR family transcriptional regulator [Melioribacter sp. OK-6-Me]|uniref:TetR/AcrR family transcriptional regulator n=1 Tax=unclassified Melioribacter TaxID=2627329 RepID=UPI003ED91E83
MPRSKEQNEIIRARTQQLIIDKALALFSQKGFAATTVDDIAHTAGISKGLIYNYFESKEAILDTLWNEVYQIAETIDSELSKLKNPYDKIKYFINFTFDFLAENENFWKLYVSIALQPNMLKKTQQITFEISRKMMPKAFEIFKEAGFKNPVEEAYFFSAALDGIALNYFFDKKNFPLDKMRKFLLDYYSENSIRKRNRN